MAHRSIDRREFFKRSGQSAAMAGLGMTLAQAAAARTPVTPADPREPKTGRVPAEGEAIGIGMIGVGGMGTGHLRDLLEREMKGEQVQVRAVSDVYERRKKRAQSIAKEIAQRDIDAYTNYMDLLARDDIQAVVIATPDHWHALNSIHAMEAGKDVYCQKPVTLTTEEAIEVRDKAAEIGRIFQCGAQNCSNDFFWKARKFIAEGGIGEVLYAQSDYSRNSGSLENPQGGEWNWTIEEEASDDPAAGDWYIDWQQWLGPAPKRSFSKPRFFQFRKYWDYSGGIATDLLYHDIAPLTIALSARAPERAVAGGGIYVQHDDREVPDTFLVALDYPDDYSMLLTSSMANRQSNPEMIRGHRATIYPDENGMRVKAEDEFKEWFKGMHGAEEIVVPLEPRDDHMTNWINCVRSRRAEDIHCSADTAYKAMAAVKMAVESYRRDQVIFWDGERECYVPSHPRSNRSSKYPAANG